MLNNRDVIRGICLMGIALLFGLQSLQYRMGDLTRAGPGMFPLVVSSMLALVAVATIVRGFVAARTPLTFSFKNMGLILCSLVAFALVSQRVDMAAGIVALVFLGTLAAPPYSVVRNVQICAGLIAVAFLFQRLFGLELNLF